MQLVTKEILATLPGLYSQEALGSKAVAHVKFFDPCGRWTFYASEYDPEDRIFFGYCISPLGPDCDEYGYLSLAELEETRNRLGLPLERDLHFEPSPLQEFREGL